jgi:3-oxoacyl-[acyl-carrier protein] reductase
MKTLIVTGASRGIGKFISLELLKYKYNVVGIARNFYEEMDFETFCCDVRDAESVNKMFATFKGRKDIYGLINCAGVLHTKPVVSISVPEIDEIIDTNLKGTIFCSKYIIRYLLAHGEGRIINFSSIAASAALRGDSVYSASKAAINVFTRAFAKEVEKKGITVNTIAPGVIKTDMTSNLTDAQIDRLVKLQVLQKLGTPLNIFDVINFLLSEKSSYITGQTLSIGG